MHLGGEIIINIYDALKGGEAFHPAGMLLKPERKQLSIFRKSPKLMGYT